MEVTQETIDLLFRSLGFTNNLIYVLLIVMMFNLASVLFRFYFEKRLKNHDRLIFRRNLICEKSLGLHEEIYQRIDKLTLFAKGEDELLLRELQAIQQLISSKRLYIEKDILNLIDRILDYFKSVLVNYSLKDIKTEQKLLDEYARKFNK